MLLANIVIHSTVHVRQLHPYKLHKGNNVMLHSRGVVVVVAACVCVCVCSLAASMHAHTHHIVARVANMQDVAQLVTDSICTASQHLSHVSTVPSLLNAALTHAPFLYPDALHCSLS